MDIGMPGRGRAMEDGSNHKSEPVLPCYERASMMGGCV